MNLIRPELRATYFKWRELIWAGLALAVLVILFIRADAFGQTTFMWFYSLLILAACLTLWPAFRRGRLRLAEGQFGQVELDERKITYFLAGEGWSLSIDDLVRVEIARTRQGPFGDDVFWRLVDRAGSSIVVPTSANGADQLVDAISALNGVSYDRIIAAMTTADEQSFVIWEK